MKTQAWGWLAAAVMAAGLNASYHDGGMQWAHEIVAEIQHNSEAVLALASGRADQFLAEAQLATAKHETATSCPFAALAQAESQFEDQEEWKSDEFEMISAREQAALANLAAKRAKMEVQLTKLRIPAMSAVAVPTPRLSICPRVRVTVPRMPMIKMPTPMVHIETPGMGPV